MFNVGTGELLVILLVALIVLGPTKLPSAAKQTAKTLTELRKVSTGFQREMKAAMDDAIESDARRSGDEAVGRNGGAPAAGVNTAPLPAPQPEPESEVDDVGSGTGDPTVSTAEAAGMYTVGAEADGTGDGTSGDDDAETTS